MKVGTEHSFIEMGAFASEFSLTVAKRGPASPPTGVNCVAGQAARWVERHPRLLVHFSVLRGFSAQLGAHKTCKGP
jgi:hypothetical protein